MMILIMMMTRLFPHLRLLPALVLGLLSLLLSLRGAAYETLKVAAPSLGISSYNDPVAIGPNWIAYPSANTQAIASTQKDLVIMDPATRQILHTIPQPDQNGTPIPGNPGWYRRVMSLFGSRVVTDGTYLATYSGTQLDERAGDGSTLQTKFGAAIHIWKMPGAQFIGAIDLDEDASVSYLFLGANNGRITLTRSNTRTIRQWDAQTLAPLPDISIAENFPAIDSDRTFSVAMAGDDLVFQGRNTSVSYAYRLLHVNLATGAVTELPRPAATQTRAIYLLAVAGGHLLAPVAPPLPNTPTSMLHYDLATAQVVAETPIPAGKVAHPFFAPDGASWSIVSGLANHGPSEVVSGTWPANSISPAFQLPPAAGLIDILFPLPFAHAQGYLWFHAGGTADGTVALRVPAAPQPVAYLTARCLPGSESEEVLKFAFTLSRPVDHDVTLHVRTLGGTGSATSGTDYEPFDGDITIPANTTRTIFQLPLVLDNFVEKNESLVLEITSHPAEILVCDPEVPGIIGGSSFHRLPPVAAWQDSEPGPRVIPHTIALAGDRLIQTNESHTGPVGDAPRVLYRSLTNDNGWVPSTTLGSIDPDPIEITPHPSGLVLLTSTTDVRLYSPTRDTLLFERERANPEVIFGDTKFLLKDGYTVSEYGFTEPFFPAQPVSNSSSTTYSFLNGPAAYTSTLLIGNFSASYPSTVRKFSRTTRASLGELVPGSIWTPTHLAASGNLFAGGGGSNVWFGNLDSAPRLNPLRPANGPLTEITHLAITGTRILVTDAPPVGPPSIRIFETPSGLEVGMLLADRAADPSNSDFSAHLPEGAQPWKTSSGDSDFTHDGYSLDGFSTGTKDIVAAIRWPDLPQTHLTAARFIQDLDVLPGVIDPAPLREKDGALFISLTEAAQVPLTITTRVVPSLYNDDAGWTGSGTTIVIPAGTTTFAPGVSPVDDLLPEGTVAAPLEITLHAFGYTRTIRTVVQVLDDDQTPLAALEPTLDDFGPDFAPVAGGWAYRADSVYEHRVAWTGDDLFTHGSNLGFPAREAFANAMAGTGDWLAVTHDAWGGPNYKPSQIKPSQIRIYQPATSGKTPVRVLKGLKDINHFGQTLFARDKTLWVGAPGSIYGSPKPKQAAGQVLQYDLPTGKKTRTFKAPKTHAVGFGSSITANDTSVWIGSTASGGAVFQYSRGKGKLLRTLAKPDGGDSQQTFGTQLAANSSILVAASSHTSALPVTIRGFAEATGELLWDLAPPDGRHFSSFTFITDDILATGGDSLIFYRLIPGTAPELLVEVVIPGNEFPDSTLDITKLQAANGQLALLRSRDGGLTHDAILLTLSQIEKLVPYLPEAPAALALTEATATRLNANSSATPPPPALTLSQTAAGNWRLQLPPAAEAAATSTSVQFSIDLARWDSLATVAEDGSWQLVPDAGADTSPPLEGVTVMDGVSLQVPSNLPRLFFRLHTP